jgi:ABC-2 type transport system ATP-binding protein
MSDDAVIRVDHVYKDFVLQHEKASSIKGLFTGIAKGINREKQMQHALRDVTFEIKTGEFFGIVGRNGSGKSTLLKILAGIYQPTSGSTQTNGKLVPFIELGVGFNPELTGRENVYLNGAMLGFSRKEIAGMYDEIVNFAEIEEYMDKKLKNYSSGMQVRLAFSMAIRAEAEILLVDEVLAVGDADFQRKCYRYFKNLKRNKKTVIFVSHDMSAVEEYCDRALLIEDSRVIVEGTSHEVAMAYTRMFLDDEKGVDQLKSRKKRWGNKLVEYDSVTVEPAMLKDVAEVKIRTVVTANADVDEAVLGFKFRSDDDTQLFGTNNKIKKQRLQNLKKGDKYVLEWTAPNVFNTGNYQIDVAAQSQDYDEVYDWWEDAALLQVERDEDSSYPFHPIMTLDIKKSKK